MKSVITVFWVVIVIFGHNLPAQHLYFPPVQGEEWETISMDELNWNTSALESLIQLLETSKTKAFILLKDGKMAMEWYGGTFTRDSIWYWASAGKTVSSFMVGIAQQEGFLDLNEPSSTYLGKGWSSLSEAQESMISIRNHLTMTTGLNDQVGNSDCTDPECLQFLAEPGTRWAYHNAPYTLLQTIVSNATQMNFNFYMVQKLRNRIGMRGGFVPLDFNRIYFSEARSMARFGLLMLAKGRWGTEVIMSDTAYFQQMITPSNSINPSYGYLWWLNGQEQFMLPQTQLVFPGSMIPNAPSDMYVAAGLNSQLINVVPSKGLVIIRMGENPELGVGPVSVSFNQELWDRLNAIFENTTITQTPILHKELTLFPNPARHQITLKGYKGTYTIADMTGKPILKGESTENLINIARLTPGVYVIFDADGRYLARFEKQ